MDSGINWFWLAVAFIISLILAMAGCDNRSVTAKDGGAAVADRGAQRWDGSGGDAARRDGPVGREWGAPADRGRTDGPLKRDLVARPDRRQPDGPLTPLKDTGPGPCKSIGAACAADKECCTGYTCAKLFSGARLCTKKCTQDNKQTPLVNEDTCPGSPNNFVCANIASPPTSDLRCLKRCNPQGGYNPCPAGLACDPLTTVMTVSSDKAVCGWPACKTGKDCPVHLSKLCTPASPAWQCQGMPAGVYCAPVFLSSFSGRCAYEGVCEPKSGLCTTHKLGKAAAKVGDPCVDDRDCGGSMECLMGGSTSGVGYWTNGYCAIRGCAFSTLKTRACPSGSTCSLNYYGGRCLKTCDLSVASSCRGYAKDSHGDYECRAWNNTKATTAPVCEGGFVVPCSNFTGTKLTCAVLGGTGNPTDMACRDLNTGQKLSQHHVNGYCLDNTSSGK